MPFVVRPRQTVLFVGDSITDCERRGNHAPLGSGYVRMAHELVLAHYPAHRLRVINEGISGNTIRDLAQHWTDDVIRHKPDWLSVKIGINDIHQWLRKTERSVSPQEFAELYDHILTRARKETKAKLVLIEPFFISTDRDPKSFRAQVLADLPKYGRVVRAMAKKHGGRVVAVHEAFQRALKHHAPDVFCPEPVHPYASGHLLIATEWMKAMGS